MNAPHAAQAIAALTGKVLRLRASASQPRKAARQHASTCRHHRLAEWLASNADDVPRELGHATEQGIA